VGLSTHLPVRRVHAASQTRAVARLVKLAKSPGLTIRQHQRIMRNAHFAALGETVEHMLAEREKLAWCSHGTTAWGVSDGHYRSWHDNTLDRGHHRGCPVHTWSFPGREFRREAANVRSRCAGQRNWHAEAAPTTGKYSRRSGNWGIGCYRWNNLLAVLAARF